MEVIAWILGALSVLCLGLASLFLVVVGAYGTRSTYKGKNKDGSRASHYVLASLLIFWGAVLFWLTFIHVGWEGWTRYG